MTVRISAVVCTRNRSAALDRCLAAFASVDFDPAAWELIIVNNDCSDDTDAVVQRFAAQVPFRVLLVHESEVGLALARNRGRQHALGPIIAMTDDDCYVAADWLTRILEGFAKHDCGYLGGRVLLHDPTDAPETIKVDETPQEIPAFTCVTPGFMHGANLAVRREVWDAIGGFDPMFGAGQRYCPDDTDLIGRASAAGWKGMYLPGPVVSHHHRRKPGPDVARLRRTYARGRGAYYVKGCLDPRMRSAYLHHWYWHLRVLVKSGQVVTALREIGAGIDYLSRRLAIGFAPMTEHQRSRSPHPKN